MTIVNEYDLNDLVRLRSVFTVDDVNTDPTEVTLKVKDPSGTTTTYLYSLAAITKEATGIYYKDITLNDTGIWYYRFEGTGTVVSADESSLIVLRSEF
jgi:hypothetical protein